MTTQATGQSVPPRETRAVRRNRRTRDAAWFPPRRQPGRIGSVSLARLLVFEVVQLTLCFVLFRHFWALIVAVLLGVASAVVTFGWRGDRWWTEIVCLYLRFRRRGGVVAAHRTDRRLAALCELAPDLTVEDTSSQITSQLGMGSDGAGWFAVLEVSTDESGVRPPVPISELATLASEFEHAGAVVQVVQHSVPLTGSPARDYVVWVSVRLDAQAVARSVVEGATEVTVPTVLAELVRRAQRLLRRRGLSAHVLDSDGLLNALVRSCDLAESSNREPNRPHEAWDSWHSTNHVHACFWIRSWPHPEQGTFLLSALSEISHAQVNIAVLLEPGEHSTGLRGLVRVATTAERFRQTCATVVRLTEHAGGQVSKLDGQQLPAVYASAPTGGGAR